MSISRTLSSTNDTDPRGEGRICPGRFFADDSVFLTLALLLHVFELSRPLDENGQPVDLKIEWRSGLVA